MKFEYTGRHVDVTPAIRVHVEDHFHKIEHILDGDDAARVHVRIEVEKNRHTSEILLQWRDHTLTATDTNHDMYHALSRTIAKVEKQAVKLKKKLVNHKQSARRISVTTAAIAGVTNAIGDAAAQPLPGDNMDGADGTDGQRPLPRIIAARRYAVKPMTSEEAVLRLSEEANQFLVFRDAETSRVGVIYKRKDGNFGLIEP